MPNHVTNILTVTGERSKVMEFLDSIESEYKDDPGQPRPIDFNRVVPMPEALKGSTEGGGYECTFARILCNVKPMFFPTSIEVTNERNLKVMSDEQWENFKNIVENIRNYDHASWYGWSIENWGTKWNAYDQSIEIYDRLETQETVAVIKFDTAWSPVGERIIIPLMRMWPDLEMTYEWSDEDSGSNTGRISSIEGEISENYFEDQSNEAYEQYLKMHPYAHKYIVYDPASASYKYVDEEDEDEQEVHEASTEPAYTGESPQ